MKISRLFLAIIILVSFVTSVFAQIDPELMRKAEAGDAKAQFDLGELYYDGIGIPQDYKKAAEWITKAANQRLADAQLGLGIMYFAGLGVPQDYNKAVEWVTKAANQGLAEAQFILGDVYYTGLGVPQDYNKASEWHTKAANQGLAEAQIGLGTMYCLGQGVVQDIVMCCAWLYLSKDTVMSAGCDDMLTQPLMEKTLWLMKELEKNITYGQ